MCILLAIFTQLVAMRCLAQLVVDSETKEGLMEKNVFIY